MKEKIIKDIIVKYEKHTGKDGGVYLDKLADLPEKNLQALSKVVNLIVKSNVIQAN